MGGSSGNPVATHTHTHTHEAKSIPSTSRQRSVFHTGRRGGSFQNRASRVGAKRKACIMRSKPVIIFSLGIHWLQEKEERRKRIWVVSAATPHKHQHLRNAHSTPPPPPPPTYCSSKECLRTFVGDDLCHGKKICGFGKKRGRREEISLSYG